MDPEKQKKIAAILKAIREVESSGGKNLEHKPITRGVSTGDTAMGQYGLTPNTMREMLTRNPNNPYSDLKDIDLSELYENEKTIPSALKRDPKGVENAVANDLAGQVIERQEGNIPNAIGSWMMGHNRGPKATDAMIKRSPAAQEYIKKAMPVYESNYPKLMDVLKLKDEEEEE